MNPDTHGQDELTANNRYKSQSPSHNLQMKISWALKILTLSTAAALTVSLVPQISNAAPKVTQGATCKSLNKKTTVQSKTYTCVKKGKKLVWSKGVINKESKQAAPVVPSNPNNEPSSDKTSNPQPNPSSNEKQLPVLNSSCSNIGTRIPTSNGYIRCDWPGGATSVGFWRMYNVRTISTSVSNNYKAKPQEGKACEGAGDTFDVPGGYLECRWTFGQKLEWIKINTVKQSFTNTESPQGIDVCRLKNSDATPQPGYRNQGHQVGFPMENINRHGMDPKGSNEVLVVGVDFPELRGNIQDLKKINEHDVKWMTDWYRYFSNGMTKFNVTTLDYWVNSPRSAASYIVTGNDGNSATSNNFLARASQPFIDLITEEIDLRKFSTVYMIFPDGETTFDMDLIVRNERFKIKEGEVNLNFFGWGHDMEMNNSDRWTFYIHETLHDFGIVGHAPGNGWPLGMMQNQSGISMAMNPYEQFLLDWLPDNQIFCQDANSLRKVKVSLSPLEREDKQTKMVLIRLSATKLIVVQAHGIDKWSSFDWAPTNFPPGFYAVMAYVVDLNKVFAPPVSADQRSLSNYESAWAVWQKVVGGPSTKESIAIAFGENLFEHVAVLGDSFLIEGIRIKVVGTGDFETIEISKA